MRRGLAVLLLLPTLAQAATYHVSKQGNDSAPCGQGARQSINAGIACLQPGDTLVIGGGTYAEIVANVQTAHTTSLPNNVTLRAEGRVVLRPGGTAFPGGGGVITLTESARNITLVGLNVEANQQHTQGILVHGQGIRVEQAEISGGRHSGVASFTGSQMTFRHLRVHHNGRDGHGHGFYVCGTDKVIEQNVVHDNANYGIQVSCESGGIRRAIVRGNLVYNNRQRGIQIQGQDNLVEHNTLKNNGIGIGIGGGGGTIVQRNTISGYHPLADNYGILSQVRAVTIRENHLSGQRGTAGYIAWTSGQPTLTGNRCDRDGAGCQSVGPASGTTGARPGQAPLRPIPPVVDTPRAAAVLPPAPVLPAVPTPPPAPARVEA